MNVKTERNGETILTDYVLIETTVGDTFLISADKIEGGIIINKSPTLKLGQMKIHPRASNEIIVR